MKRLMIALMVLIGFIPATVSAQDMSNVPDVAMFKMMLDGNKSGGWVSFREYDGHQWVYFTPLATLRCRIKEVRYSFNSDALDQTFEQLPCIPALPFSIPSDAPWDAIAKRLPSQSVQSATVQVTFEDDSQSEIITFAPCEGVGDMTCARILN